MFSSQRQELKKRHLIQSSSCPTMNNNNTISSRPPADDSYENPSLCCSLKLAPTEQQIAPDVSCDRYPPCGTRLSPEPEPAPSGIHWWIRPLFLYRVVCSLILPSPAPQDSTLLLYSLLFFISVTAWLSVSRLSSCCLSCSNEIPRFIFPNRFFRLMTLCSGFLALTALRKKYGGWGSAKQPLVDSRCHALYHQDRQLSNPGTKRHQDRHSSNSAYESHFHKDPHRLSVGTPCVPMKRVTFSSGQSMDQDFPTRTKKKEPFGNTGNLLAAVLVKQRSTASPTSIVGVTAPSNIGDECDNDVDKLKAQIHYFSQLRNEERYA